MLAPQLAPYFAAAARSGLSLVWKIVLVVELMGRSNGVGFEINVAFQLFDMTLLLAYALPFVGVMLAIETFAVQPLRAQVSRAGAPARLEVAIEGKAYRGASGERHDALGADRLRAASPARSARSSARPAAARRRCCA